MVNDWNKRSLTEVVSADIKAEKVASDGIVYNGP